MLDDSIYEGDETFTVSLQNPIGGAALGSPSLATVTITENDLPPPAGSLQFSGAAYSVSEADGLVTVTVTRSGGSAGTISADYATSDLTATAGSDYTSLSGTLTSDSDYTAASLGAPVDTTVTITENNRQNQPAGGKKKGGGAMSPITLLLVLVVILFSPAAGFAGDDDDPHAQHKKMMASGNTHALSTHAYDLQGIGVTKADSSQTTLAELISDDKPVMVHFIFTTCTTICPVQAATFSQVQRTLGDEASEVQMISVSIDPEYDTPAKLQDYAKKFRAGPQWEFLTGTPEQMIQLQKAFDAYGGNKMNHKPLTLLRGAGADEWIRLEGLVSASDILAEYMKLKSGS